MMMTTTMMVVVVVMMMYVNVELDFILASLVSLP